MEEIRSTESLDREIEADAYKKAAKIEKSAATSMENTRAEWRKRLEDETLKEKEHFAAAALLRQNETAARLALDKQRLSCEMAERCLVSAVSGFLASLQRDELLDLLEQAFCRRLGYVFAGDFSALKDEFPVISSRFLDGTELEAILKKAFSASGVDYTAWRKESAPAGGFDQADIALVFDSAAVRISVSAGAEARQALLDKRSELVAALLGDEYV